jgi:2-dehydro-3-deoxygluconokinase
MADELLRIACLGECMIELRKVSPTLLAQSFAGDTYNTAVYLRRLDPARHFFDVQYATGVGSDAFADEMLKVWEGEGIGNALTRRIADRSTGLYAIRTDAHGERHFSYWRDTSAARAYFDGAVSPLESEADAIDVLYLSGVSLAVMASALPQRLPALLRRLRNRAARIVFDNNYRARLWPDPQAARDAFAMLYANCDIAFVTLDDEVALHPHLSTTEVVTQIFALSCPEVVLKRGALPTLVRLAGEPVREVVVEVVEHPVDTTAAGDSFAAGYLAQRLRGASPVAAAQLGNRLAAAVIQYPGAIIAHEAMADVLSMLDSDPAVVAPERR